MASSKKRKKKNGKTSVTVRIRKGGIYLCRTFPNRKEADRWRQQVEFEIGGGRTFWAAADFCCQEYSAEKKGEVRRRVLIEFWREEIGNLPVSVVAPERISAIVEEKLGNLASSTVGDYRAALSGIFKVAIRLKWLLVNPADGVSWPLGSAATSRWRVLSRAEEEALLSVCRASPSPFLYPVVLLALCSGASKGELVQLDWQNVDLVRRRVSFSSGRSGVLRPVEIPEAVAEIFREIGDGGRSGAGLCFPASRGPGPVDLRHAWGEALRSSGLIGLRFEDLRETLVARMVEEGYSLDVVAVFLGLKDSISLKRHAKPFLIR